jgi:hypothetical protein
MHGLDASHEDEPIYGHLVRRHRSQTFIAPQISGDTLQLQGIDGMPLLLQPMRASGNPEDCGVSGQPSHLDSKPTT